MKKNVGSIDKIIRFVIAAVALILIVSGMVTGTLAIVIGIVGGAMLLTSIFGFCGLYTLLGFNTCPAKK